MRIVKETIAFDILGLISSSSDFHADVTLLFVHLRREIERFPSELLSNEGTADDACVTFVIEHRERYV